MNKIIAVVGMCGSGKSIACDFFEKNGFKKVYFGGITLEKLEEEGLEVNPVNEKYMREKLRNEYGMGAFAHILLPRIKEYFEEGNVILDGLYSWEELKILKHVFKDDLTVLAIVVNKKDRYERLSVREIRPFTNVEAENRDVSEIENIQKAGPISFADYYVLNNGNLNEYKEDLEFVYKEIMEVRK